MGEHRSDSDTPPYNRRLTVREAADDLGISEAAVRNRITRGTLQVEREDGSVYVLLEPGESASNHDESSDEPADESRLIDVLQDQVQYLRGELEAEREARRRADHIIAALAERIPELEAPPQSAQEAESVTDRAAEGENSDQSPEERTEAQSGGERVSWWRRIFNR